MALRTGISIIAGSTAAVALSFVASQWWGRRRARVPLAAPTTPDIDEAPIDATEQTSAPSEPSVPIHVGPIISDADARLQELDGGVSARPTEQWHDSVEAYDAASPDDLGAVYLSRAVEAPELDESSSDLDENGLHIDQLADDDDDLFIWAEDGAFAGEAGDEKPASAQTPGEEDLEPDTQRLENTYGTTDTSYRQYWDLKLHGRPLGGAGRR